MKKHLKKAWHFIWHEDSAASWIANVIIAFVLIRYLIYPLLGVVLGTSFPIVAVLSESMEHGLHNGALCGERFEKIEKDLDTYWSVCGEWYEKRNITQEQFATFPFRNGFNKGDVIILYRATKVDIGDILVFQGNRPQPIIHRVVNKWDQGDVTYYHTKGDHNSKSIPGEDAIHEERVFGKGILRIPYIGWIKILFVDAVSLVGITIER